MYGIFVRRSMQLTVCVALLLSSACGKLGQIQESSTDNSTHTTTNNTTTTHNHNSGRSQDNVFWGEEPARRNLPQGVHWPPPDSFKVTLKLEDNAITTARISDKELPGGYTIRPGRKYYSFNYGLHWELFVEPVVQPVSSPLRATYVVDIRSGEDRITEEIIKRVGINQNRTTICPDHDWPPGQCIDLDEVPQYIYACIALQELPNGDWIPRHAQQCNTQAADTRAVKDLAFEFKKGDSTDERLTNIATIRTPQFPRLKWRAELTPESLKDHKQGNPLRFTLIQSEHD